MIFIFHSNHVKRLDKYTTIPNTEVTNLNNNKIAEGHTRMIFDSKLWGLKLECHLWNYLLLLHVTVEAEIREVIRTMKLQQIQIIVLLCVKDNAETVEDTWGRRTLEVIKDNEPYTSLNNGTVMHKGHHYEAVKRQ